MSTRDDDLWEPVTTTNRKRSKDKDLFMVVLIPLHQTNTRGLNSQTTTAAAEM